MGKTKTRGGLVYSTDQGRMCPVCGQPQHQGQCARNNTQASGDGIVRVGRATRGRKGKGVTTISGLPLPAAELKAYAKQLKQRCGTGGAVKDGVIEIQGDQRDMLVAALREAGWQVKRSGG